jgi:hypothetical protein
MLVCALLVHIAHETAGAARIRHSLRPLRLERAKDSSKPRAHRAARSLVFIAIKFGSFGARPYFFAGL